MNGISEPATKRRKIGLPQTFYNGSQPSQSSFVETLEKLKEESAETQGMDISQETCCVTSTYS